MAYILAIFKDRNITLSSAKDLEISVVEVIDLILKDYDMNPKDFSTNSIQLRKELIEAVDGAEEEEEIDSLVELFLLRNNISEELDSLFTKAKDEISVSNNDDPLWELTIYLEQSKLVLEASSYVYSDYPWDALLKNVG
jgi:hypothetical protein